MTVHENETLETCFTGDAELAVKLAKALHRRHHIDRVEYKRFKTPDIEKGHPIDDTHFFVDREFELTERDIETSWSAEGSTRTYWVQLAREAMRMLRQQPLTDLPAPLRCMKCRGHGTYLSSPAGIPFGTAKVTNQLTRVECDECKGTGEPNVSEKDVTTSDENQGTN